MKTADIVQHQVPQNSVRCSNRVLLLTLYAVAETRRIFVEFRPTPGLLSKIAMWAEVTVPLTGALVGKLHILHLFSAARLCTPRPRLFASPCSEMP